MFKKRIITIVIAGVSLLSVAFIIVNVYLSQKNSPQKLSSVTGSKSITFNQIVPGQTTKDQVIQKLGNPLETSVTATDSGTLFYKSTVNTMNDSVYITSGTVTLIKEIVSYKDTRTITDITNVYGIPIYSLFSAVPGTKLYIYPDKGTAFVGNAALNSLEEIWYFAPTSLENFEKTWAQGYSETQSGIQ